MVLIVYQGDDPRKHKRDEESKTWKAEKSRKGEVMSRSTNTSGWNSIMHQLSHRFLRFHIEHASKLSHQRDRNLVKEIGHLVKCPSLISLAEC